MQSDNSKCVCVDSLSLHAYLKDTVTCSVIANIWLKNPSNFLVDGYQLLAEIYIVKVLCVARRWDDVRPFLDSGCPGLSESTRDSLARQVAATRRQLEETEANRIEVLESDDKDTENTVHQGSDYNVDLTHGNYFHLLLVSFNVVIMSQLLLNVV